MMPVYAALHIIPPIVLRRKVFLNEYAISYLPAAISDTPCCSSSSPSKALIKSFIGTMRSCGFLATFVTLFQGLVCTQRNFYNAFHGKVPVWLEAIIMNKGYYFVSGESICLPSFADSGLTGASIDRFRYVSFSIR